ncbi:DUF2946 domain-containing protein [Paracidovorax oryzae]|uniref:DUF2946 domain-containing protein n=1 Tax=Paracidovorax oryzae TaxID=862720 RepID=UPI00047A855C|nr:DUF2946 domain-containing protein [Paracidovorax oryzae]
MSRHRPRSPFLWLAIVAILWGSLMPAWSSVLAAPAGKTWIEVCTSQGPRLIAADTQGLPADHALPSGMDCPFCRLLQDVPAIACLPGTPVVAGTAARGMAATCLPLPPRLVAVWSAHPSRAPPSLS